MVLHPLGARGTVRGFLAVGRPAGFDRTDQSLVAVAVSLLSLAVERGGGGDAAGAAAARDRVAPAPGRLATPTTFRGTCWAGAGCARRRSGWFACRSRLSRGVRGRRSVGAAGGERVTATLGDELVVVVPDRRDERRLRRRRPRGCGRRRLGARDARDLRRGLGAGRRRAVASPGDQASSGTTPSVARACSVSSTPTAARAFADSLLAPLDATGGKADLLASTRAWLAHHGQWDVAAQELGVHRHTLRYRIRRVEELLGRSLDDADLRAELWFALELRSPPGRLSRDAVRASGRSRGRGQARQLVLEQRLGVVEGEGHVAEDLHGHRAVEPDPAAQEHRDGGRRQA